MRIFSFSKICYLPTCFAHRGWIVTAQYALHVSYIDSVINAEHLLSSLSIVCNLDTNHVYEKNIKVFIANSSITVAILKQGKLAALWIKQAMQKLAKWCSFWGSPLKIKAIMLMIWVIVWWHCVSWCDNINYCVNEQNCLSRWKMLFFWGGGRSKKAFFSASFINWQFPIFSSEPNGRVGSTVASYFVISFNS